MYRIEYHIERNTGNQWQNVKRFMSVTVDRLWQAQSMAHAIDGWVAVYLDNRYLGQFDKRGNWFPR